MAERGVAVRRWPPLALPLLVAVLAGCTAQQVYDSTQGLRLDDCQRLAGVEREDCLGRARLTYPEREQQGR